MGSSKKAEHKWRKQRLEKLDSTISELPQCFEELLKSLNGYCSAGLRLSSLFGTVFEDTPLLLVAMRFKEASEQLEEKCKRLEIMLQPEFVSACKKIGPCVSHQRSCLDSHAKSLSKYESAQNALDALNSSPSTPKQKLEQAEVKFKDALSNFAKEDTNLAHATDELDKLRVEVTICSPSCLSFPLCFLPCFLYVFLSSVVSLSLSLSLSLSPLFPHSSFPQNISSSLSLSLPLLPLCVFSVLLNSVRAV